MSKEGRNVFARYPTRAMGSGLILGRIRTTVFAMVTLAEIESLVFKLPKSDRARLAADLLDSLSGVLVEDDDGLAEALRRSEEMDRDPSACLTHEEFLKAVGPPA
jgi:putative addiction module component (TIGR02574 family)